MNTDYRLSLQEQKILSATHQATECEACGEVLPCADISPDREGRAICAWCIREEDQGRRCG